jgi:hypothetical protein
VLAGNEREKSKKGPPALASDLKNRVLAAMEREKGKKGPLDLASEHHAA